MLIEFESKHSLESIEKKLRQRTPSRSDLENPCWLLRKRCRDSLCDRLINQKVLAEPTAFWTTHESQVSDFGFRISDFSTTCPENRGEGREIRNFIVCRLH